MNVKYIAIFREYTQRSCSVKELIVLKKKVKFTLEQAMKAQRGRRCIALLFP
jgi:hypothetical protein